MPAVTAISRPKTGAGDGQVDLASGRSLGVAVGGVAGVVADQPKSA